MRHIRVTGDILAATLKSPVLQEEDDIRDDELGDLEAR